MSADANPRAHLVERAADMLRRQAPQMPPLPATTLLAPLPSILVPLAALQAAGLLATPADGRPSRAKEEFALVQHQLLRQADEATERRIILVASALPREGRSFIALNLAAGLATSGARRVLLVDADGRASALTRTLSIEGRAGLRQLVADPQQRGSDLMVPTGIERLCLLSHGRADARLPGGTLADAVSRLAASLPQHILVLDTPPALSSSDVAALATAAGQLVLVVDAQRTARSQVEAALDLLEACPVLQLLLNRARLGGADSFGGGAGVEMAHAP